MLSAFRRGRSEFRVGNRLAPKLRLPATIALRIICAPPFSPKQNLGDFLQSTILPVYESKNAPLRAVNTLSLRVGPSAIGSLLSARATLISCRNPVSGHGRGLVDPSPDRAERALHVRSDAPWLPSGKRF